MGYSFDDLKARIAQRSDITLSLVHLTRDQEKLSGIDVLIKILTEQKLCGSDTSSGFIVGKTRAVCFQEAPIYSLAQNIYTEQVYRKANKNAKVRYLGFGISISKDVVYRKGGRPVIYDKTQIAKSYLPESEWWRIVNFDLSDAKAIIDWSHEREWRVPGDFEFSLSEVTILLPNAKAYQSFVKKCKDLGKEEILKSSQGIVQLGAVFY
jgi:hypothetical protein